MPVMQKLKFEKQRRGAGLGKARRQRGEGFWQELQLRPSGQKRPPPPASLSASPPLCLRLRAVALAQGGPRWASVRALGPRSCRSGEGWRACPGGQWRMREALPGASRKRWVGSRPRAEWGRRRTGGPKAPDLRGLALTPRSLDRTESWETHEASRPSLAHCQPASALEDSRPRVLLKYV